MAYKQVFFDPSASESGQDGTYAHPWTRQSSLTNATLGDECDLFVRRGLIYGNTSSAAGIFYASGLTPAGRIRWLPYGDEEMPPTAMGGLAMAPGDTGWSYLGDGVWKKSLTYYASVGSSPVSARLFVGGARITGPVANRELGTGYSWGTPIARAAIEIDNATVSDAQIMAALHKPTGYGSYRDFHLTWDITGLLYNLYVYTGTALQDPPTFYDGIVLVAYNGVVGATGFGRKAAIRTSNSNNIEFVGLEGIWSTFGIYLGAGTTDATWQNNSARDCNIHGFGVSALYIAGSTPARVALNYRISDCLADARATKTEDWNFRDKGNYFWLNGSQDGATIGPYSTNGLMERCTVLGSGHANFYAGVTTSAVAGYTVNARFVDCYTSNAQRGGVYGYHIAAAGLGVGNVATFDRFHGTDCPVAVHKTGSGKLLLRDSKFMNGTRPFPAYDATAGGGGPGEYDGTEAMNLCPFVDVFKNAPFGAIEAGSITAERCTFMQPYGWMLELASYGDVGGTIIPTGTMQFTDCVFVDTKWLNTPAARTYNSQSPAMTRTGVSLNMRDWGGAAGAIQFNNVYYYTGTSGSSNTTIATNPNPTSIPMASFTGLTGTWSEVDPMVDDNGRIASALSPLRGAATSRSNYDQLGIPRRYPNDVGAHEYVEARPSRF